MRKNYFVVVPFHCSASAHKDLFEDKRYPMGPKKALWLDTEKTPNNEPFLVDVPAQFSLADVTMLVERYDVRRVDAVEGGFV